MAHITPIKSTTQKFTEIEEIRNNVVLFSDGSVSLVIGVSAVNFGLLSEKEQDSMIYAYAQLLNSLSFPVQIIIRSQQKDVTSYLLSLAEKEKEQTNPKLANSIHTYRLFVESTVKEKQVLDKKFYIVIPFSKLELGASPGLLFGSKAKGLPYKKEYIFERALMVILPKRDQLFRLLARLGLKSWQLSNEQLIRLFFTIYNPTATAPSIIDVPSDPFDPSSAFLNKTSENTSQTTTNQSPP